MIAMPLGKQFSLCALLILLFSSFSYAQTAPLTMWTHPPGAIVRLDGPTMIQGRSPLPVGMRLQGEYKVRVKLKGYETATGSVHFRLTDGVHSLDSEGSTQKRRERFFSSLLVPGSGQIRDGRRLVGGFWASTCVTAGIAAIVTEAGYREAHDEYIRSGIRLDLADRNDREAYLALLGETFRLEGVSNVKLRERNTSLAALGFFWGINLIDAAVFRRSLDIREGSRGEVQISLVPKTGRRCAVRSALFPGLGQSYGGKNSRAFLYASSAIAMGMKTVFSHLNYMKEEERIDNMDRMRAALVPGGPLEAEIIRSLDSEREAAVIQKETYQDRRNLEAIITGGIWIASILDAALFAPRTGAPEEAGMELAWLPSVAGGSAGIGVRCRF